MTRTNSECTEYQSKYYTDHNKNILRNRHLRLMKNGKKKSMKTLTEYNITLDDFTNEEQENIDSKTLDLMSSKTDKTVQPVKTVKTVKTVQPVKTVKQPIQTDKITKKMVLDEVEPLVPNKTTFNNYITRLNTLDRYVKCSNDLECLNDYDKVVKKMNDSKLKSILPYISTIIAVHKKSKLMKTIIDSKTIDQFEILQKKLSNEVEEEQDYETDYKLAIDFNEFTKIRNRFARSKTSIEKNPFEYLLTTLYTKLPFLRDDFGQVKIVKSEKDIKNTNIKVKEDNYLVLDKTSRQLILNKYKLSEQKKKTRFIDIDKSLMDVIKKSLEKSPRDWLITKNKLKSNEVFANGKLSAEVKRSFDGKYGINDIRHSYASKLFKQLVREKSLTISEWLRFVRQFNHNVSTQFRYIQNG